MEPQIYDEMFRVEDRHWWHGLRRRLTAWGFAPALTGANRPALLDLGCGTGGNLAVYRTLVPGGMAVGVDISALALAYCRRRGLDRLVRADANRLPFRAGVFRAVAANDILYHRAADEARVLAEAGRALGRGGRLVVTESAAPWLAGAHDRLVHAKHRYTRRQLIGLIEEAGFTMRHHSHYNALLFPAIAAVKLWKRRRPEAGDRSDLAVPSPAVNRRLGWLHRFESWWIARGGSFPCGTNLLAVAEKR